MLYLDPPVLGLKGLGYVPIVGTCADPGGGDRSLAFFAAAAQPPRSESWHLAPPDVNIYWINLGDGSLMKAPLGGGSPTLVAPGQPGATSIALDATSIYWSVNAALGSVLKIDK